MKRTNYFFQLSTFNFRLCFLAFCLLLSAFCLLPSALNAQIPDYNPYQYAREELFLTSFGVRENHESDDCVTVRALTNKFYNADAKNDEKEKYNALRAISFFQCNESYSFLHNQIKESLNEKDRCQAIMFLAWMLNPEYLPTILKYSKKKNLSTQEKAAVATAFMVYGVHGTYPDLKDKSIALLDEICDETEPNVLAYCILSYFNLKGESAIKFFNAHLEKEEFALYAALFLVQLGEYEQTFPIFAAALSSDGEYEVNTAILGLAAIGTEEAIELIINLPPEKNRITPRESLIYFNLNEIKERR